MNSEYYKKVLCSNLPPKICAKDLAKGKEDNWVFVQDNARWHKTREIMQYLEQEAPLYMRDFPPYSPEFNIIEDIWSQMAQAINEYEITSISSLKRHLKKAWADISWETVRKSVDSLPKRCKECIKAHERFGY